MKYQRIEDVDLDALPVGFYWVKLLDGRDMFGLLEPPIRDYPRRLLTISPVLARGLDPIYPYPRGSYSAGDKQYTHIAPATPPTMPENDHG